MTTRNLRFSILIQPISHSLHATMKKKSDDPTLAKIAPRLFLSYTHEDSSHKEWVLKLATDLRAYGVDAILDRWECKYGSDLNLFMEKGIRDANRVLLVCTPAYQKKADTGTGGVGYERLVVTAEMAANIQTEKFICVLRRGDDNLSIPSFARSRLFIDFRNNNDYDDRLLELLRDIHIAPLNPKPPIGASPFGNPTSKHRQSLISSSKRTAAGTGKAKPPLGPSPFTPDVIAAWDSPIRRRLPETRVSITHQFEIAGHRGYLTVGMFEDGQLGELFIKMNKEGSTLGGLMDTISSLTSIALQYGVPIESLVKKFAYQRFEPSGTTKNPEISHATSITDYVFRWVGFQFIKGYKEAINSVSSVDRTKKEPSAIDLTDGTHRPSGTASTAKRKRTESGGK